MGNTTILRLPVVLKETGRSRSSHYSDISMGLFTSPIRIGLRAVGWLSSELTAINSARIFGNSDDEIRTLVIRLEAARKIVALVGVNHE